ncbi:MAG TPA: MarR family transcriptional regulator [Acidimicrobiales bacterium]
MDELQDGRLTLMGLFAESYKGLHGTLEARLGREVGLPMQWFELLLRLARSPEHRLRMTDLAAQTGLTPSGLTRAVDRLCAAGLVERVACPADRRVAYAALTPAGLERIRAAVAPHLRHIDESLDGALTDDERRALGRLLRKLRDHVNPAAATVTPSPEGEGPPPPAATVLDSVPTD